MFASRSSRPVSTWRVASTGPATADPAVPRRIAVRVAPGPAGPRLAQPPGGVEAHRRRPGEMVGERLGRSSHPRRRLDRAAHPRPGRRPPCTPPRRRGSSADAPGTDSSAAGHQTARRPLGHGDRLTPLAQERADAARRDRSTRRRASRQHRVVARPRATPDARRAAAGRLAEPSRARAHTLRNPESIDPAHGGPRSRPSPLAMERNRSNGESEGKEVESCDRSDDLVQLGVCSQLRS